MAYFILGERRGRWDDGRGGRIYGTTFVLVIWWVYTRGFILGDRTCFQNLTLYHETSCRNGLCQGSCKLRVSVSEGTSLDSTAAVPSPKLQCKGRVTYS